MIRDIGKIIDLAFGTGRTTASSNTTQPKNTVGKFMDSVGLIALVDELIERSAIMEHEAKMPRENADLESAKEYLKRYKVTVEEI